MSGMIEPTQGTGLSGITGKSGKHGKNSLFAKLFAMLEKRDKLAADGKLFGLSAKGVSAKTGVHANPLQAKQHGKGGLLLETKSKHLLALATQKQESSKSHTAKSHPEDVATPLVAHVLIDPQHPITKGGTAKQQAAQANTLLAGEQHAKQHGDTLLGKQHLLQNKSSTQQASTQQETVQTAIAHSLRQSDLNPADNPNVHAIVNKVIDSVVNATTNPTTKSATAKTTTKHVSTRMNTLANMGENVTGQHADKTAQHAQTQMTQTTLSRDPATDKTETGALAAQLTGSSAKPSHTQQQGNSVANLVQNMAAASPEHQASDNNAGNSGGQSGNPNIGSLLGDASRADPGARVGGSQFQSYLTQKDVPTLSPMDAMKHIAHSASNGQTKLEIQLDPAHLGKIHISLQSDASKQLQVHMIVDQSMTRHALEQQLPQLRHALAQQGFDLSGFSMDSQGQQASGQEQQSHSGRAASSNRHDGSVDNGVTVPDTARLQRTAQRRGEHGVSIRV